MLDPIRVLVIDDDPKVPWILSERLSSDFQIMSASDGYEGIQMAAQEKPDLILLDMKMPGMDGLQVLERLRPAKLETEVIMLSGHGESETVASAFRLGAAEFRPTPSC